MKRHAICFLHNKKAITNDSHNKIKNNFLWKNQKLELCLRVLMR